MKILTQIISTDELNFTVQQGNQEKFRKAKNKLSIRQLQRSNMTALIVVRHSERLDEVDKTAWRKHLITEESNGRKSCKHDPIISPSDGVAYAKEVAATLKLIPEVSNSILPVKIYSSRMRRAVQTASIIAMELRLPVYLSAGLAQIVPDVKKSKGKFEFADNAELERLCAGVTFIDCDDRSSPEFLPPANWRRSTARILMKSDTFPIIVGHRETVRKLARRHLKTPYCCVGLFGLSSLSEEDTQAHQPHHHSKAGRKGERSNDSDDDSDGDADGDSDTDSKQGGQEDSELYEGKAVEENITANAEDSVSLSPEYHRHHHHNQQQQQTEEPPRSNFSNSSNNNGGRYITINPSGVPIDATGRPVRRCGTEAPYQNVGRGGGRGRAGSRGGGGGSGGAPADNAKMLLERLYVIDVLDRKGSAVAQV